MIGLINDGPLKDWGLCSMMMKGELAEWDETSVCVPPNDVTAYCLLYAFGGVSAVSVYVGLVSPVMVAPVTGDAIAKDIAVTYWK